MIIYHYYSIYTVFTSFVSKIFFVLAYFSQTQIQVKQTHKKTQEHFDRRGKTKEETKNAEYEDIDTELLLFDENCIILRKSYLLLLLLLMLLSLIYPAGH